MPRHAGTAGTRAVRPFPAVVIRSVAVLPRWGGPWRRRMGGFRRGRVRTGAPLGSRPLRVGALLGGDPLDVGRALVGGGLLGGAGRQFAVRVRCGMPDSLPGDVERVADRFGRGWRSLVPGRLG